MTAVPSDQRDRQLSQTCLNANIMLEAGAGTGKTTVMVERIYQLLSTGTTTIEKIAAITFTDKAAAELRDRIRTRLDQAPPSDLIRAARAGLAGAKITTLHSFALSILRERPIEAGVSPGPRMLSPIEASVFFDDGWNKWLSGKDASSSGALRRALLAGLGLGEIKSLAAALYQNRDLLDFGAGISASGEGRSSTRAVLDSLASLRAESRSLLELASCCADPVDSGRLNIEKIAGGFERISISELEAELQILNLGTINCCSGNKKYWSPQEACREQKERLAVLQGELVHLQQLIRSEIALGLVDWLTGFVAFISQLKQKNGNLDFQDLLITARNLLRDNLEARKYFQDQFDALLVDEFQDTDPLQAEIAFFMAEKTPVAKHWLDVKLMPGKLFVVGDPKQSIYRFRRADIELYEAVKKKILAQGMSAKITQNFRSQPEIISWVNTVFRRLIKVPPDGGSYQPMYHDLHSGRPGLQPAGDRPAVFSLSPTEQSENEPAQASSSEIRAAEAVHIADLIFRAVNSERWDVCTAIDGNGSESHRPITYKDISILLPQFTNIDIYEQQLQERGIPYLLDGGKQYYSREETTVLSAAISSIANPGDEVSLIATLRSLFFGISDEQLLLYRHDGGSFNYLEPGRTRPEKHPHITNALGLMESLHCLQHKLSPGALIMRFLKHTGAIEISASRPSGPQRIQNLLKIVELARAFAATSGGGSLSAFSRWLDKMEKTQPDEPDPSPHDEKADAVRILTIHKSKGLEAHMVVLADIAAKEKPRRDRVLIRRNNAGLPQIEASVGAKNPGYFCTPGYESLLAAEHNKIEAEKIRLFYVAATRARDYLAISLYGATGKEGCPQSFHRYLSEESQNIPQDHLPGLHGGPSTGLSDQILDKSSDAPSPVTVLAELERWRKDIKHVLSSADRVTATNASELKGQVPIDTAAPAANHRRDSAEHGALLGSALHEVLEHIQFDNPTDLKILARAKAQKFGLTAKQEATLCQLTTAVLSSEVITRAKSSAKTYKEIPFTVPITVLSEDGEPFEVKCEGKIDLLFEDHDGRIVIVDYKSDKAAGEALEERFTGPYKLQGQIYAEAVKRSTGKAVKEVVFLFARTEQVRSLTGEDLLLTPPPLSPFRRSVDPRPSESPL